MSGPLTIQSAYSQKAPEDADDINPTEVNLDSHFSVVDAFDMPPVRFDPVRSGFVTWVEYPKTGVRISRQCQIQAVAGRTGLQQSGLPQGAMGTHKRGTSNQSMPKRALTQRLFCATRTLHLQQLAVTTGLTI